jgi:DNA-binding SARP family transcriptional activator
MARPVTSQAMRTLRGALSMWRGPAFANVHDEPFAQASIGRLDELRIAAIADRIDADLALRRHAHLVGELETLVGQHPLRERLRAQLMLALYGSGQVEEALRSLESLGNLRARIARVGHGQARVTVERARGCAPGEIHRPSACQGPGGPSQLR